MNQVALVGRLTKDPELRVVGDRRMQTSFTLAVNRSFKNQSGDIEADFILCTVWGRTAENTAAHCGKGSLVGVSGRIQTRSYEREDGTRAYVTEVIGDDVRFLMTKKPASSDSISITTTRKESSSATDHFDLPADKQQKESLPIF